MIFTVTTDGVGWNDVLARDGDVMLKFVPFEIATSCKDI
jgi:hypothetical protein